MAADVPRLAATAHKLATLKRANEPHDKLATSFDEAVERSRARRAMRAGGLPKPAFPDDLPIAEHRTEIAELVAKHQVVIVCGETGSGKTTQLPKICLALGRGTSGLIGCTQPRRIAARSLATRLSHELKGAPSHAVGYKIRFQDHTHPDAYVKVMTDGILLAETHGDHDLLAYDTLIIDEAHERNLNIDFLLGYLKRLLPRRPDLKVIITSATIDPERFSRHFGGAPVIEVSGRTYPVELRYRPQHLESEEGEALDLAGSVLKAVDEVDALERGAAAPSPHPDPLHVAETEASSPLRPTTGRGGLGPEGSGMAEADATAQALVPGEAERPALSRALGASAIAGGDVLVFLPGEREIRECAEALRKHHPHHTEILPLYARLSSAEQDRIFQTGGRRRIILSTNVAETSLTVPGIQYVIDSGLARINRYSPRSKINQLQIEKISRASARQRAGRCGRVSSGIAIRLYSEADHDDRPEYTTPEILRTSLAAVILRMKELGLGDIVSFPFLEAPSARMIDDGYRLLFELGAVNEEKELTPLGWELSRFPIDPRIGRMLLAAKRENCLGEMLIICSALSIQDPRDRPHDKQHEAMLAHEKFADPQSDFIAYVKMWAFYDEALRHKKSARKLAQSMRENFLSPFRLREWRDIHGQLAELIAEQGAHVNAEAATYDQIHRALLSGLLGNVGTKSPEGDHYQGTRAIRFHLPASGGKAGALHAAHKRTRMKWIMAGELTETTRVYARTVARIEPEWIEALAPHLVTRTYFEPHWERKSAQVAAFEQVSLYGLVINPRRRVHYGAINAREARVIFIRDALVAGEYDTHGAFLKCNRALVTEIEELEHKARRQDVLVDEDVIFALYDEIIPPEIVNGAGFEKWRRAAERSNPKLLEFTRDALMRRGASEITFDLFPKSLKHRGGIYPLKYRFEPAHVMDGVTLTLPVAVLNQVEPCRFEWLVMGMLRDKIAALLKSLPQRFRSPFVPVPDTVNAFIEWLVRQPGMGDLSGAERPLVETLTAFLKQYKRVEVSHEAFDPARIPPHLLMNFRIVDADGAELAMGRDFAALRGQFKEASRTVFSTLHRNALERENITKWDFGDLPEEINFERNAIRYDGYPALVDCGESVTIRIFDDREEAQANHHKGLVRLFSLELSEPVRQLQRALRFSAVAAFHYAALFPQPRQHSLDALKAELMNAAVASTFLAGGPMREAKLFAARRDAGRSLLAATTQQLALLVDDALAQLAEVKKRLDDRFLKTWEHVEPDINGQIGHLFYPGFIESIPADQLAQFPRYLKAIQLRIDKMKQGAMERDLESAQQIRPLWQNYLALKNKRSTEAQQYRWMIEELRVSLFAQELRTPYPVSVKRLHKTWEQLNDR